MPLFENIQNDDVLVFGLMENIANAAPNATGVCNLVSPINGKLKLVGLCVENTTNAQINLTISTKHGTMVTLLVVPNATPISTVLFNIPQHDRANFVDAGEPITIQSDGGGSGGGRTNFFAVFRGA